MLDTFKLVTLKYNLFELVTKSLYRLLRYSFNIFQILFALKNSLIKEKQYNLQNVH